MNQAEKLSSEWNNTGFVVLNKDGSLSATVWNNYKWEADKPEGQRPYVASVDANGWVINAEYDDQYELTKESEIKVKHTEGKLNLTDNGMFCEDGKYVMYITRPKEERRANTERMVKCWNMHDELVGALESLSGIEAWIGDEKMKELFQSTVYPIIKKATS